MTHRYARHERVTDCSVDLELGESSRLALFMSFVRRPPVFIGDP
jgi:hypothetical protein